MKYNILHRTRYVYAAPVHDSFNDVRLRPASNQEQTVDSFLLRVLPSARLSHYTDFNSNWVHHFEIPEAHEYLMIESHAQVNTRPAVLLSEDARPFPLERLRASPEVDRCYDFLQGSRFVDSSPEVWRLAVDATNGQTDAWQAALAIMRFVNGYMSYSPNTTHVHTHMHEVITQRRGVCQDYAHVTIGMCRALRIPARYVSGYLASEKANATHAWVEVFIPEAGWRALDPTHNCQINETYVKIGVGRDYADVPPVSGNYRGTQDRRMEIEVRISPLT